VSQKIVIINYGMGNLRSVQKAFEKIGFDVVISNEHDAIKSADKIVLPGVGAFGDAMKNLNKLGLVEILNKEVLVNKKPFLGICLGMQLIAKKSQEFGETEGLSWIDANIVKFPQSVLKIPHVGWNEINLEKSSPLFKNIPDKKDFYFVHSYYFKADKEYCIASCDYGINFICAVQKENIFATQFHPEKSQIYGLEILKNFVNLSKDDVC